MKQNSEGRRAAGSSERAKDAYLVLGCKPWNRRAFDRVLSQIPGRWVFLEDPDGLRPDLVRKMSPRFVFCLHWSWKVPSEIVEGFECVCFHMTDVPFGRGGSPLQNLIVRGYRQTKLTALRMSAEFDAGPVYLKEPLSLEGGAEEIYLRAEELSVMMIKRIIREELKPVPQQGKAVDFKRRKPAQSRIEEAGSLLQLFDFIRMLDAEGYPQAFLEHSGFRFELSRPALYDGRIVADVKITLVDKEPTK